MKRRFADWVTENNSTGMTMAQVSMTTVERFRAWMKRKGLSAKTINDNVAHLGLFWDAAPDVDANPWRKLKPVRARRNDTEDRFEPITRPEMEAIFQYLNNGHRPFARMALMIYYCWARTIELCRLRVGDIDLTDNVIHFSAARTKNRKGARVQIVQPLREILLEMELEKYPVNFYLFSDGWMPGSVGKKTNEVSERWRDLVKVRLGIGKSMYALKHTGNIDYLLQNKGKVDLKWQQMQNRHSSSAMTERYCRQMGAYFVDTDALAFTGF
jgi:integrase